MRSPAILRLQHVGFFSLLAIVHFIPARYVQRRERPWFRKAKALLKRIR